MRLLAALSGLVGLAAISAYAAPARDLGAACNAARNLHLPHTRILSAEAIHPDPQYTVQPAQGSNTPAVSVMRPFCRVSGVIEPAIRFEVWLPLSNWNARFEGVGLGAFLGALPYREMATALAHDFAVGGTDAGHESSATDASWAMYGATLARALVEDWSHRGIHEMTRKSKAVVASIYGRRARHSYFVGCSSGGHQALTEAQRYPQDYDGIVAGAPANYWTHLMAGQLWYGLSTRLDPATDLEMPQDRLALIHQAVLRACDARDGVLENPLTCDFDPAALACKAGQTDDCLTQPQVQALQAIYGNAQRQDGSKIFPGLARGGELGWPLMSRIQVAFAQTFYRDLVYQTPNWNYAELRTGAAFEQAVARADQQIGAIVNSINPDLAPFRSRGGKLLQYHGWSDPLISPFNSVDYYESVLASFGASKDRVAAVRTVQQFYRLFMVPGMNHCRGGDGTDNFDALTALERWVEESRVPQRLEASKQVDGRIVRTRPLCPYPQVARYRGTGSTDDAASYDCVAAL
jgi:feruloyl esterase